MQFMQEGIDSDCQTDGYQTSKIIDHQGPSSQGKRRKKHGKKETHKFAQSQGQSVSQSPVIQSIST